MALNIKNPQAEDEVAKLAALTGESKAEAVLVAARERRERLMRAEFARIADLERRLARIQERWRETSGLAVDDLYDESGLPA